MDLGRDEFGRRINWGRVSITTQPLTGWGTVLWFSGPRGETLLLILLLISTCFQTDRRSPDAQRDRAPGNRLLPEVPINHYVSEKDFLNDTECAQGRSTAALEVQV